MAHQVKVNAVQATLPNGINYPAGSTVILTDKQFALIPPGEIARVDASPATTTAGSSVVTDAAILASDAGRAVGGNTGLPETAEDLYVGTVTAGVSFVLVDGKGNPVNATATVTGITIGDLVDQGPLYSLGHLVTAEGSLEAGDVGIDLPNGLSLLPGQAVLLDDDTFSKLSPTVLGEELIDGGVIAAAQAPTVGAVRTFAAHAVTGQLESVVRCDATGGAFTESLPVAPIIGRHYVVIKIDASGNAVTVAPSAGTGTINGAASQSLATQYANLDFVWDGTNWFIST
jgi:hypothetical protein